MLIIAIIRSVADGILMLLQIAMLVRAVLSWFPAGSGSVIGELAYTITEPVIAPVRRFLERFPAIRNFPFDISFLITFLLISMLSAVLFP